MVENCYIIFSQIFLGTKRALKTSCKLKLSSLNRGGGIGGTLHASCGYIREQGQQQQLPPPALDHSMHASNRPARHVTAQRTTDSSSTLLASSSSPPSALLFASARTATLQLIMWPCQSSVHAYASLFGNKRPRSPMDDLASNPSQTHMVRTR